MRRPPEIGAVDRVRSARRGATPAEQRLWQHLRARQLHGAKFRRQTWIGPFIADFLCAEAKLIVEVDGESHARRMAYDQRRTDWLAKEGFRLVRVTNADVMGNIDGVLAIIAAGLPSPSHPRFREDGPLPLP